MIMDIIEFFFGNFWHWLGLILVLAVVFGRGVIRIENSKSKED